MSLGSAFSIPHSLRRVQVAAEVERDRDAGQGQDREEPEEEEEAGEAQLQNALGEASPAQGVDESRWLRLVCNVPLGPSIYDFRNMFWTF